MLEIKFTENEIRLKVTKFWKIQMNLEGYVLGETPVHDVSISKILATVLNMTHALYSTNSSQKPYIWTFVFHFTDIL